MLPRPPPLNCLTIAHKCLGSLESEGNGLGMPHVFQPSTDLWAIVSSTAQVP